MATSNSASRETTRIKVTTIEIDVDSRHARENSGDISDVPKADLVQFGFTMRREQRVAFRRQAFKEGRPAADILREFIGLYLNSTSGSKT